MPDSELQPVADQDFISNAIIYQPKQVTQVGQAQALGSEAVAGGAFENARTPLAATFTSTKGGGKHGAAPTTVVVNHFKSKGSAPRTGPNRDSGDGQGAWNAARVAQASAVVDWIPELTKAAGSEDVAVLGDFNSYAQEDPMQEFYGAGYTQATEDDYTYVFGGQVGSLDHLLVSPSLKKRMTGADAGTSTPASPRCCSTASTAPPRSTITWRTRSLPPITTRTSRVSGRAKSSLHSTADDAAAALLASVAAALLNVGGPVR